MAFSVNTYKSEDALASAIQADVNTLVSESALNAALALAVSPFYVLGKGGFFTLIDNPQIVNVSLRVVAKGAEFTVILETV